MDTIYFVGTKNNKRFSVKMEKRTAQDLLQYALDGEDKVLDTNIALLGLQGECIDAMSWEHEKFIKLMIAAMDVKSRFAIHHGELVFGVSTDEVNAAAAFQKKEF